jgi:hypothetical protein
MKIKTIEIDKQKSEEFPDTFFGKGYLYPEGTKRIIRGYYLFPATINDETRRGTQLIEQEAVIRCFDLIDTGIIHYNKWINLRFLSKDLTGKL